MVDSKLLKRLKKLKALADDPNGNPNETATAAALYAEIMAEHGISQTEVEIEAQEIKIFDFLEPGTNQMPGWEIILLNSLARTSCCQMLVRGKSSPDDDGPENVVIVGAMEHVQAMAYSFEMLKRQINSLCEDWQRKAAERDEWWDPILGYTDRCELWAPILGYTVYSKPEKKTPQQIQEFAKGVAVNVGRRLEKAYHEKLRERTRTEEQNAAGLVLIDRQQEKVRETVQERLGGTRGERAVHAEDQLAFMAGQREGSKIKLEPTGGALSAERRRIG